MSERSENFNWLPPDDPLNRDNVFEMSLGPNVSVLDDDNQLLMPDQVDLDFLSSDDQFLGDNFAVLTGNCSTSPERNLSEEELFVLQNFSLDLFSQSGTPMGPKTASNYPDSVCNEIQDSFCQTERTPGGDQLLRSAMSADIQNLESTSTLDAATNSLAISGLATSGLDDIFKAGEGVPFDDDFFSLLTIDASMTTSPATSTSSNDEAQTLAMTSTKLKRLEDEGKEIPLLAGGAQTYLCPICGNQSGRHAHYGGYSCPSCRAFFRRSVQSKAYKTFTCSSGNCKINSKSWRSCKWCRFQKCLQSGMKPEWVLDKNERHSKTEKRSVAELNQQALQNQHPTMLTIRTSNFTNDELLQILSYVDCRKMNMSKSLLQFYSSNPYLFRELASAIYNKNILPFSTYKHLDSKWPCTMEDFVIKDSELGSLSEEDSFLLLQTNFPLLQIFIQSVIMINRQHFKATPLATILKRSLNVTPLDEDKNKVEVLSDVLKALRIDSKGNNNQSGLAYSQVFSSPWAESKDLEERHAYLTKEMSSWPVNPKDPAKHVDKVQLFLLANIIMLTTDNVAVKDYTKVTEIQDKYMTMLHRYLKYKYREKNNTYFAKGLMISSLAREAKEIRKHRLPV